MALDRIDLDEIAREGKEIEYDGPLIQSHKVPSPTSRQRLKAGA